MGDFLRVIDFITDPTNIALIGLSAGIIAMLLSRGAFWVFGVSQRRTRYLPSLIGVLTVILVEVALWSFFIWYNTPLDPPLDLK